MFQRKEDTLTIFKFQKKNSTISINFHFQSIMLYISCSHNAFLQGKIKLFFQELQNTENFKILKNEASERF